MGTASVADERMVCVPVKRRRWPSSIKKKKGNKISGIITSGAQVFLRSYCI